MNFVLRQSELYLKLVGSIVTVSANVKVYFGQRVPCRVQISCRHKPYPGLRPQAVVRKRQKKQQVYPPEKDL